MCENESDHIDVPEEVAVVHETAVEAADEVIVEKSTVGKLSYCGGEWVGLKPRSLEACAQLTLLTSECDGGDGIFVWKGDYTPKDPSCRCCKDTTDLKDSKTWDAYDAHEVGNAVEEVVTGEPDPVFEGAAPEELKFDKIATGNYCNGPVKFLRPRPLADCAAKTLANADDCGDSGIFIWKGDVKPDKPWCRCCKTGDDKGFLSEKRRHKKWTSYKAYMG